MNVDLSGKCLIEVSDEACAACLAVQPNCSQIAEKKGLRFVKIAVEDCPEVIGQFRLERLPSIIIAEDGNEIAKCSGYQPTEILEMWVDAKIGRWTNR